MATDVAAKAHSKRPQGSLSEPADARLMKAVTKLWLRTRHTVDQETQREEIFSLWLKDLSHWSTSQTLPVLTQLAVTEEWWPAWKTVVEQLPVPDMAISYENPWARIKAASVRVWAERVVRAYMVEHRNVDREALIGQATTMVLNNGAGGIGPVGLPFWSGEDCLAEVRRYRDGQAA